MYLHMSAHSTLRILSDPVRLALVDRLKSGDTTVGDLAQVVGIAQSGVSRHLKILHQAGIVSARAEAQRRIYRLNPEPFLQLESWLSEFHHLWSARLDRFAGALTQRQLEAHDERPSDDHDGAALPRQG